MREDWYADNWLLTDGWVRDVEYRSGLYRAPGKRGDNPEVANRRGLVWRPKQGDVGSFTLNLWLGGDSRAEVEPYWDNVIRACMPGHRLVRYLRTLAGGSSRWCMGEVVQATEPSPLGNLGIRAALEVTVPDGVWFDNAGAEVMQAAAGAALPQRLPLAGRLAGITAELHNGIVTIDGPINNPQVFDVTDGVDRSWVAYDGVLAAGQSLIINTDTWAVTGGGGFAPDIAKVRYNAARYLVVPPAAPGSTPTIELRGAGGGATTRLSFSAVPTFAC